MKSFRFGGNLRNGSKFSFAPPGGISSADPDYLLFGFIESSMARIRVISPFRESR